MKRLLCQFVLLALTSGLLFLDSTPSAVARGGTFYDSGQALVSQSGDHSLDVTLGDLDGDGQRFF